ncbi:MAG: isoprenylcysteine carboxylmethyltransferase family protein [Thalassospira sp.]|uniref:methyltransferase family protein n=1 Tax=Thalassospira sp. TaxID=1912094 RepID=UPI0032EDEB8F
MASSSFTQPPPRKSLTHLQRRRKLTIACLSMLLLGALPLVHSLTVVKSVNHETVEMVGIGLILIAILGRAWCTLYIGGRKAQELTRSGPYSISRNPLYLFSFIGAAGIGAQTGSLVISALFVAGAFGVFLPVILREERALKEIFGSEFSDYQASVPRFGPRFSKWQDAETIEVKPRLLWRTIRDGLVFLMVIPIFELIDWVQLTGLIHPMVLLP